MAILGTIRQQPSDRIDYDIDCSDFLGTADTILSVASTVDPVGPTITTVINGALDTVKVWVSGGTTGNSYKIEVTVTTTLGRIKQDELKLKIKEV